MKEQFCKLPIQIALLGTTGVGKDTTLQIIKDLFPHCNVGVIRLATPLYEAQNVIYKICGKEKEGETQDGVLLNFLGQHMRNINPHIIQETFLQNLNEKRLSSDIIICCDARPIDVPFIKQEGFWVVNIAASEEITLERRRVRGDLTLGCSNHQTEKGIDPNLYDYQIMNDGSIIDLKNEIIKLMNMWTK